MTPDNTDVDEIDVTGHIVRLGIFVHVTVIILGIGLINAIGSCTDAEKKARQLQAQLEQSQAELQKQTLSLDVLRRALTDELAKRPDANLLAPPADLTLPVPVRDDKET